MYSGQLVFAQLMDHLPWQTFRRIVAALRWRPACARFQLCESVPLHGVRAAHLSREPARHRNVPACPERQALPLGYSRLGGAQHAGRRERSARLAHLRRVRAAPDSHRASALRQRTLWRGPKGDRLRAGLDHHRPVLVAVPVGTVSLDQGRDQAAHADRSARQHPELHPHLRRETARRQRPGRAAARGRLPSTSWIAATSISSACTDCIWPGPSSSPAPNPTSRPRVDTPARWTDPPDCSAIRRSCSPCSTPRTGYPDALRRIRFKTDEGKTLVFLTNNFALPALTITELYRCRWQVELFFKWIKQHLRIKSFFGTSENAVKTQVWIAVSVYVLVAIVRKRLALDASLYETLQILSLTIFETTPLDQLLTLAPPAAISANLPNQLNLFES